MDQTADDWRHRAACGKHPNPDMWFSRNLHSAATKEAKRICWGCPVQRDCGDDAIRHNIRAGVAGGYHTRFAGEWAQLHIWLGRKPPEKQSGAHEPRSIVCAQCRSEFQTRRQNTVTRCPPCEQGLVDAAPVRKHVERVHAETGWSYREIAQRAGLSKNVVGSLMTRQQYINRKTAELLRAVRPDLLTDAA
ncbi:WhiB family transcriptional regulator [Nocardia sp. NPDC051900]|uniref:WhiB family transcriptional regulator n=1 Tax=Nocardia sp. NPDC051900 TaxID=3364326 RepID=UPI0037A87716